MTFQGEFCSWTSLRTVFMVFANVFGWEPLLLGSAYRGLTRDTLTKNNRKTVNTIVDEFFTITTTHKVSSYV